MRTELAAAQRRDPRLVATLRYLKDEPQGSYFLEPRRSACLARAGALRYRLTTDGVLVAALEEGGTDRPVVPDATHSPGPRLMTWKHMLLGAVHNTVTGQHRNAKEMAAELAPGHVVSTRIVDRGLLDLVLTLQFVRVGPWSSHVRAASPRRCRK